LRGRPGSQSRPVAGNEKLELVSNNERGNGENEGVKLGSQKD